MKENKAYPCSPLFFIIISVLVFIPVFFISFPVKKVLALTGCAIPFIGLIFNLIFWNKLDKGEKWMMLPLMGLLVVFIALTIPLFLIEEY